MWKDDLVKSHHVIIAEKIADPVDYIEEESFMDLKLLLKLEDFYRKDRENNKDVPSYCYEDYEKMLNADLFSALKKD
jgi:hypothetical protein